MVCLATGIPVMTSGAVIQVAFHLAELLPIRQNNKIPVVNMYSAFANSCPLQTDTILLPFIHKHHILLSLSKL